MPIVFIGSSGSC